MGDSKPDFGMCPACDKPRLSGQFFVPEFDGLETIHVRCAKKLGWTDPNGEGATHFDPDTGKLIPLVSKDAAPEGDAPPAPETKPAAPPPTAPKGKGPFCLVRPPEGVTSVAGKRRDGSPLSVAFNGAEPRWMDEEAAVAVVKAGGVIEGRK